MNNYGLILIDEACLEEMCNDISLKFFKFVTHKIVAVYFIFNEAQKHELYIKMYLPFALRKMHVPCLYGK